MTKLLPLEAGDWVRFSKTAPMLVNRMGEPEIGQTGEYCGVMHYQKDGNHIILFKWENDNPYDTFKYDHVCLRSQLRKLPTRRAK